MGITREVGIYLAIDTKGVDIDIEENEMNDLFFRPFCERIGKKFEFWLSNNHRPIPPQQCGDKLRHVFTQIDENRMRLSDKQLAFLERIGVSYTLTLVYLEYWS